MVRASYRWAVWNTEIARKIDISWMMLSIGVKNVQKNILPGKENTAM